LDTKLPELNWVICVNPDWKVGRGISW
jgi:hypothetical protein